MTNPTNPARGTAGRPTGSSGAAVDAAAARSANGAPGHQASPWGREAGPGEPTQSTPNETTSALPVVAGPDPYAPPASRSAVTGPIAGRPPAPMNAVDQYAALAAAEGRPASAGAGARVGTPPPGFPPVAGAPSPVGAVPGAPRPPAAAAKVTAAKAIRRPKNARSSRRAKLQLKHLNVWSVLRFSCVLAIALFFVWLIMVGVLYGILDVTHVFSKVNDTVRTINGDDNSKDVITPGIVFGGAFIIGLVNIVLFIALSTIGSVVYNLCADLVGGVEVTLAEHE